MKEKGFITTSAKGIYEYIEIKEGEEYTIKYKTKYPITPYDMDIKTDLDRVVFTCSLSDPNIKDNRFFYVEVEIERLKTKSISTLKVLKEIKPQDISTYVTYDITEDGIVCFFALYSNDLKILNNIYELLVKRKEIYRFNNNDFYILYNLSLNNHISKELLMKIIKTFNEYQGILYSVSMRTDISREIIEELERTQDTPILNRLYHNDVTPVDIKERIKKE